MSLCFSTTTTLQVCRTGILLTVDKMKVMKPVMDLVKGLLPRYRQRPGIKSNVVREHRDGCASRAKSVNGGQV